ncbi:MAG: hypothetical protein ACFBSE_15450 [Prochloraceae cyanobacterium]
MLNIKIDRAIRLISLALVPAGMIVGTLVNSPVKAHHPGGYEEEDKNFRSNDFDVCLRQLLRTRIPEKEAGDACARALEPTELSSCVEQVYNQTPVGSRNALQNCFQVRRPLELSTCVVDIYDEQKKIEDIEINALISYSNLTLDFCRRSLLPQRYSECVVALSRDLSEISPPEAMEICISAEAYPESLFPTAIE